ncbi:MAG: hypothetical protein IJU40_08760, partial [Desulfovibrionaceae bacterium]|nr:hypothetical protein [Desulfovibrionaceae bacterium]
ELNTFLASWVDDPNLAKVAFIEYQKLLTQEGVSFSFKGRPGISYSLRAKHVNQTKRELFVLIDVVDDEPDKRWLSVCFYNDMVQDPLEKGDFVPQGLLNEDALCFNLDDNDSEQKAYIAERLQEALAHAAAK